MKKLLAILFLSFATLMTFHQAQGQVLVSGSVFEQDSITPIAGASVMFSGIDAEGDTVTYQLVTDTLGHYEDFFNCGAYQVWVGAVGYEFAYLSDSLFVECDSLDFEYDSLAIVYDSLTGGYISVYMVYDSLTAQYDTVFSDQVTTISNLDFVLYEILFPVRYVMAQPYDLDFVRVSWSMSDSLMNEDTTRHQRSFRYYEVFRRRKDEGAVLIASHLTDTVFMETNWSRLPWGRYAWGVSCHYEGNRSASDTIWSAFLDKDMTTTLEVHITTNVGLSAAGAVVTASSADGQGLGYQVAADADGNALIPNVYRGMYDLVVHLDGYVDFCSVMPLSVMEPLQVDVELTEAIYAIDSLYVSSTGYVMWRLSDTISRDLQRFELRLNGQTAGSTLENTFQFDINGLTPGDTCRAEIRVLYLSDTSCWYPAEWVYRSCIDFAGSDETLQCFVGDDGVLLSWDSPESALGVFLYRDGEFLGFVEGNSYFDAAVEMHGEATYCLRMVHDGPTDGTYYSMSCEECVVAFFPVFCDPPMKLEGENYWNNDSDYGTLVSWGERPDPIYQWLHYDDGVYKQSLGGDNEPIIFWSIRFEVADLEPYLGCSLKKISLFDVGAGVYQLWIYVGGETSPRTLVWSQTMTLHNANAWHEEVLSTNLEIPEDEPIWIVVGQQGLSRPAAACADMGNPNGRWVSLDGEHWTDMSNFNMHYTWMLRTYVTNRSGRMAELKSEKHVLQQYNLYRSYDNIYYQLIASVPAVEEQVFYRYRDMLVDDGHEAFYYQLTAVYLSEEGEICESDFAASLHYPENQYVYIDNHWSAGENEASLLQLYPNPANTEIHIELPGMQHIAICNGLGQVVFEKDVDYSIRINLSSLPDGLYWVRVVTQNGVATKPFVVAR